MKKLLALLAMSAMTLVGLPNAGAGPTAGGVTSDTVEYVGFVPFEVGSSTGVTIDGKYMYQTSWKNISIYDISDPTAPELLDYEPIGFMFENENVAVSPDGRFLLFSESLPNNALHIYDVEDKSNITPLGSVEGAGDHTTSCILKCKWAYGSDGSVTDLRNIAKPVKVDFNWHEAVGLQQGGHDVEEYKNGYILVSTLEEPFMLVDVRNPLKPKVLARGEHPNPWGAGGFLFHSGRYPNKGKDKFVLMQGEDNFNARCNENNGPFMTWDASNWKKTGTLQLIDTYRVNNGTYADGSPAVNGLGCSAHWFQEHPDFKNGGLVTMGYYEHGTRFFQVDSKGKIKETGWFLPYGGSTSAAYWVTKDLVYAVDYTRGIDILRYVGKA